MANPPQAPWNSQATNIPGPNNNVAIDQFVQQQEALREQIQQSEQNLTAQHTVDSSPIILEFYLCKC